MSLREAGGCANAVIGDRTPGRTRLPKPSFRPIGSENVRSLIGAYASEAPHFRGGLQCSADLARESPRFLSSGGHIRQCRLKA